MRSLGRHWANNVKRGPNVSHNRPRTCKSQITQYTCKVSLGVPQHARNNGKTPFKLFQARMTMPVAWCIPSSKTANAVALRLLSFLSGFVANSLLYQLSIHNTTHCWCILFHVVRNLTAALPFTESALYRA